MKISKSTALEIIDFACSTSFSLEPYSSYCTVLEHKMIDNRDSTELHRVVFTTWGGNLFAFEYDTGIGVGPFQFEGDEIECYKVKEKIIYERVR